MFSLPGVYATFYCHILNLPYLEKKCKGDVDFDFTCLLHTYFKVEDINNVTVHDLKDLDYIDKVWFLSKPLTCGYLIKRLIFNLR